MKVEFVWPEAIPLEQCRYLDLIITHNFVFFDSHLLLELSDTGVSMLNQLKNTVVGLWSQLSQPIHQHIALNRKLLLLNTQTTALLIKW